MAPIKTIPSRIGGTTLPERQQSSQLTQDLSNLRTGTMRWQNPVFHPRRGEWASLPEGMKFIAQSKTRVVSSLSQ